MKTNKLLLMLMLLLGLILGIMLKSVIFPENPPPTDEVTVVATAQNEHGTATGPGDEIVRLSSAALPEFGIELATAGEGLIQQYIDLTGEIKIDPDRLAHIVARFPGLVKDVHKKIGDKVRKGEVLAVIESNESLAPYQLTSLIDGTVIEMHLTKGEVITDASHDIVVADLRQVWVDLNVYQKDLQYIAAGQPAVISGGENMPTAAGKISYISPVVDEQTRTAIARVVLSNSDGRWRPGLFVNARVIINSVTVPVVVPKTALETYEDQVVVFIQTPEGFKPQPVSIGRRNDTHVEILEGLKQGQTYAAIGGFTLKAELQKESFGGGHGH